MSEYRRDPITGRWRIIAEGRSARPNEYSGPPPARETDEHCPFCTGHESRTPPETAAVRDPNSVPDGPGWSVRAIPNRYPTVAADPEARAVPGAPPLETRPATGVHEVVIESPHHAPDLPYLAADQRRRLFRFLRERVRALAARPGLDSILVFENRGSESGGTLPHPHAQIVATGLVPPRLEEERAAFARGDPPGSGGCLLEAIVERERATGARIVEEDRLFTAFAPFASEYPYEVWIVPRRHAAQFSDATDAETDHLAELLPSLLRTLDEIRARPSYNWFVHGAREGPSTPFHWHVEIAPRLVRADGYEVGSGVMVNPVAPETAAADYRGRRGAPGAAKA